MFETSADGTRCLTGLLLTLFSVTGVVVLVADAPASATHPGANGKIAHRALYGTGGDDISVVGADGTAFANLTDTAAVDETSPAWQPLNRPPVTVDDTYTLPRGIGLFAMTPGVLGNDSDPDGDTLTVANPTASSTSATQVTDSSQATGAYRTDGIHPPSSGHRT